MSGDFAAKFIRAYAFLFVCSLAGKIFFLEKLSTKKFATIVWLIKTQIHFNLYFFSKYISIRSNWRWLLIMWAISISRCSFSFMQLQHLCWNLFLIKIQGFNLVNLLKRDSEIGVCFPANLVIFLRTPILENICELLLHIKYYTPSNNTAESVAEYSKTARGRNSVWKWKF